MTRDPLRGRRSDRSRMAQAGVAGEAAHLPAPGRCARIPPSRKQRARSRRRAAAHPSPGRTPRQPARRPVVRRRPVPRLQRRPRPAVRAQERPRRAGRARLAQGGRAPGGDARGAAPRRLLLRRLPARRRHGPPLAGDGRRAPLRRGGRSGARRLQRLPGALRVGAPPWRPGAQPRAPLRLRARAGARRARRPALPLAGPRGADPPPADQARRGLLLRAARGARAPRGRRAGGAALLRCGRRRGRLGEPERRTREHRRVPQPARQRDGPDAAPRARRRAGGRRDRRPRDPGLPRRRARGGVVSARGEPRVDLALAREHGLADSEWERILEILGRPPTFPELGIFSVMWSEHCSYKSSKKYLRWLPSRGACVLQGPGENAGVVSIGGGLAAIFKIESHNHPSFIEPRQGAATGVGGILRDVFTMGARPVASLDSIRFGSLEEARHRHLLSGVVDGIGGYGNSVGVATVGGETTFHPCYRGNILVNAMSLGIAEEKGVFLARAAGVGNPVIYAGSKTGPDGIHGASLLASAEFDATSEAKRPTVQVGDPFTEKCLIEACLEVMRGSALVGIQDMGAAGLTCSSFEMASHAGTGIELDLDRVPQRESQMTPYELLLSESQERMLLVAQAGREAEVQAVFRRWGLEAVVVGRVTDGGRMRVRWRGETVVDIPVDPVAKSSPEVDRGLREPADLRERQKLDLASVAPEQDPTGALELLLDAPNLGSKAWITRQYDSLVQGNTAQGPGGDAAVIRVKHPDGTPTRIGLALAVDCNPRRCWLDPYGGTVAAVAEAARNVACTGARPLALTNCLNFGNPERPEIMWEFAEATRGLADAARELGTPVVSGNVSFYNETSGRGIFPTPTVAVVGLLEDWERHAASGFAAPGLAIVLLGENREDLAGSEWLALRRGLEAGLPAAVDLAHERRLHALLAALVADGLAPTAHDVADGGLAVALCEAAFASPGGLRAAVEPADRIRPHALRLRGAPGRVPEPS